MHKGIKSFLIFISAIFVLSACEVTCELGPIYTLVDVRDISIDDGQTHDYEFTVDESGNYIIAVYTSDDLYWELFEIEDLINPILVSDDGLDGNEIDYDYLYSGQTYVLYVYNYTGYDDVIYDALVDYDD